MNEIRHICALYSHGPHFVRLLRHMRNLHPQAHITALIPPEYPEAQLANLADSVQRTPGGRRGISAFRRLRQEIRAKKCDLLVVMFDSSKLRLLSAASGVPQRYCYSADGRYFPLRLGLLSTALNGLWRQARGRVRYAWIHFIVHHRPVRR